MDHCLRFSENFEGHEAIWAAAAESEYYARLKNRTEVYLQFCRDQWEENLSISQDLVRDLTGFDLDKEITVYVTHPDLLNGRWLGSNQIAWGNRESYPNCTTIFLWHEILHTYMPLDHGIYHSLIQFVADNELRSKLNGDSYPPFEGHEELHSLMRQMYPYWLAYLESDERDILRLGQELARRIAFDSRGGTSL